MKDDRQIKELQILYLPFLFRDIKSILKKYNDSTSNKTQIQSNHPACQLRYSKTHQKFMTVLSRDFKVDELIEEWSESAYDCGILNFASKCNIIKEKYI